MEGEEEGGREEGGLAAILMRAGEGEGREERREGGGASDFVREGVERGFVSLESFDLGGLPRLGAEEADGEDLSALEDFFLASEDLKGFGEEESEGAEEMEEEGT